MNIEELKQAKAKALADARANVENTEAYDKAMADYDNYDAQIKRVENLRKIGEQTEKTEQPKNDQRRMFANALSGRFEDVAAYRNSYTLGTAATAGALTAPSEFVEELIKEVDNETFVRKLAHMTPAIGAAQTLGFPYRTAAAADSDWLTEVADESGNLEATLAFGRREFKPNRMAKLFSVSRTLVAHSNMAEQVIREEMASSIARTQEKAYLTGNGTNKPLGVFVASNNGIPSSRDVSTASITADALIDLKYSLKAQYIPGASFIMHRDIVKAVAKLKDSTNNYIWQPSFIKGQPDTLLGIPVYMSEYAPNTTTSGDYVAILGDFSKYWICDANAMELQVLNEKYALTNEVGYLYSYFGDGMPVVGEAFSRLVIS